MSKTYLKMILISSLLTIFLVLGFAFSVNNLLAKIIPDTIYEKSSKELNIMSNNIEAMHDTVQQLTYQLSTDASLDMFLHHVPMDSAEGYHAMKNLSRLIRINPMFHSVSIYSGYNGEYYSTLTSRSGEDPFFRNALDNLDTASILKPVCRVLPQDIYYDSTTVFSYFYFETNSQGDLTKAITVNIDAAWLCSYLNSLKGNGAQAYIIDLHNSTIIDGSSQIHKLEDTTPSFIQKIMDTGTEYGCFIDDNKEEEQLITFQLMRSPDWILVMEEPNNDLQNITAIIHRSLIITILVLIMLGLFLSLFFFYRLYRPWGNLYHKVIGERSEHTNIPVRLYDDFQAINKSIQLTQNQLEDYLKYKNSADNLLLETYIRALLGEDIHSIEKPEASDRITFERFLSQPMYIALLRIDHWKQIKTSLTGSSDACTYALIQVSNMVFPTGPAVPPYKWVYLGNGRFLLLAFCTDTGPQEEIQRKKQLAELQHRFTTQTGISATIVTGGFTEHMTQFMKISHTAMELLNNSILFERQSLLDCKLFENRTVQTSPYDEKLEKTLLDAICKGQRQEALQLFETILNKYQQGDWQTFILFLTQLLLHLDKRIEITHKGLETQKGLPSTFYQILSESESLDDIREKFIDHLQKLPLDNDSSEFKTNTIVHSVTAYIKEHYKEDISLKEISAKLNFSTGYLGTLFKDATGTSVLEYMNEVRLEAAGQMILNTNLSITIIMQQCGFINESNFYRLFKTRYGVTPKIYRSLNQSGNAD